MDQNKTTAPAKVRPAIAVLGEINNGALLDELANAINDATAAVKDTGKPAKLTLTIDIKKVAKHPYAVVVTDTLALKLPKEEKPETILFMTDDNNLQAEDPHQRKLDLKAVETPAQKVREVTTK